jgi:hypothetical protein
MRLRCSAVVLVSLLAACASPPRPGLDCPVRPRPRGVVVIAHGVFPDGAWNGWCEELASGFDRGGAVAAILDWRCHLPDYWFGSTVEDAADRVAKAARALEAAHARTGCPVPLAFGAVGYSGGTTVIRDAATRGVRFREVTFGGSPIFLGSDELGADLESSRIERLVNYHSLVDGFVWPCVPMGIWGWGGRGAARVEDRTTWEVHDVHPFAGERERIVEETLASFAQDDHRCFDDPAFRAAVKDVVAFLEDGSRAEIAPPHAATPQR